MIPNSVQQLQMQKFSQLIDWSKINFKYVKIQDKGRVMYSSVPLTSQLMELLEISPEKFKEGYLVDEAPELNAKTTFGWIYDPKESKTRLKFFITEVKNLDE
ncbi:MAG: hypothetical protein QNJ64_20875 [Crocosphaera sp.]|nr:hypothetical protein [Crocosphaera sp.]